MYLTAIFQVRISVFSNITLFTYYVLKTLSKVVNIAFVKAQKRTLKERFCLKHVTSFQHLVSAFLWLKFACLQEIIKRKKKKTNREMD